MDSPEELRSGSWSGARLLSVHTEQLRPGDVVHKRFLVQGGAGTEGGRFAASVEAVEDYDDGRNEPEREAGDTTCGVRAGAGELSARLVVRTLWTAPDPGCPGQPTGGAGEVTLRGIDGETLTASRTLSDADAARLVVILTLPASADNLVQSDHVHYDMRLGVVDAAFVGAPGVTVSSPPGTVPFTELPTEPDRRSGAPGSVHGAQSFALAHLVQVAFAVGAVLTAAAGLAFALRRRSGI